MFNYFSRMKQVYDNTEGCGDTLARVKVAFKLWCQPLYANFSYVVSHDSEEGTLEPVVEATGALAIPVSTEANKADSVLTEEQKIAQEWNGQEFEDVEEGPGPQLEWDDGFDTMRLTPNIQKKLGLEEVAPSDASRASSPQPSDSEPEEEVWPEIDDPIADAMSKGINLFAAQHDRCAPNNDGTVPSLIELHEFFITESGC